MPPKMSHSPSVSEGRDLDETVRAVKRWLDNPGNSNWLIIYDNYDNHMLENELDGDQEAASAGYDIRPFFPDVYHGAILMTTQALRVDLGSHVPLKKLKAIEHSLEIISHTSQRRCSRTTGPSTRHGISHTPRLSGKTQHLQCYCKYRPTLTTRICG